eukprot:42282-Eustigmatos_ZCMA.PRE.1
MAALAPAAEVQQTQASSVQGRGTSARFEECHAHAQRLRHRKSESWLLCSRCHTQCPAYAGKHSSRRRCSAAG